MSELKLNQKVIARTVMGKTLQAGTITSIRPGSKGDWYGVKLADGKVINTRAACIAKA